nr:MAG: hypothetical protein [Microvirus sp.]
MNKRYNSNTKVTEKPVKMLTGELKTVPGQVSSIKEVVYRFQGGIIPTLRSVSYDTEELPDEDMPVTRVAGFDITDAFQALQAGRQQYREYMRFQKEKLVQQAQLQKAELERLKVENEQLKLNHNGNNI